MATHGASQEEKAERVLRAHAEDCACCRQMVVAHDAFERHTEDCNLCTDLVTNEDYCPVGLSLQEQWLDDLYDESDRPRCAPGAKLMDKLLKAERDSV